ncbi:MAG: multifunctional CCA tRNA nucleotidyl transferase/2'3'-cyclic phosphodiesterase/2'nucleotidase/phosphatase [Gammaproteobacteria bacterium]|nr:MAG: multifunctional CCA tRNA nucleotidyl transferase/2'3'-cyclic phosphodiesterase/2'nucleotidase/phosphatase [Gammaproteobacteria bacterium]
MDTYLVGGAVRDRLLGLTVRERDWVVVGATTEEMLAAGYRQVGRDFPVFIHPESGDEYALARTERKSAPGYRGFVVHASPEVTLEEDLRRRDLTINAIAQAADGTLIDPFGGTEDLRLGRLHHVSPAFVEDPVRVLRCARFAAQFARQGFRVSHATQELMHQMVADGEVDALTPERVWAELARALVSAIPGRFFEVLQRCDALARVLPEIDTLLGPSPASHDGDEAPPRALRALARAVELSDRPEIRFAALVLGFGQADPVESLCDRLRTPNAFRDLGRLAARYHLAIRDATNLAPEPLLKLLEELDAFRRPGRVADLALAVQADDDSDLATPYPPAERLATAQATAAAVAASDLAATGLRGAAIGAELHARRIATLAALPRPDKP